MKYIINYTKEGKILGFAKGDTNLNIEVSNAIWFKAQSYNKIIIDGENISFDKVDWRTAEEITSQNNAEILSQISTKENELVRPMRELLTSATSESDKQFAQSKIDKIELEIQELRKQLK